MFLAMWLFLQKSEKILFVTKNVTKTLYNLNTLNKCHRDVRKIYRLLKIVEKGAIVFFTA